LKKLKYLFPVFGILFFNIIPAYFLANNLIYIGLLCLSTVFIGLFFSDKFSVCRLVLKSNTKFIYFVFILFLIIEGLHGFDDFFSPFMSSVGEVLEHHKKTEKSIFEILRELVRTLFLMTSLFFCSQNKLKGFFFLITYAFIVSSISRSAFVLYSGLALLNFIEPKFNLRTLSILIVIFLIFTGISKLREDDKNAVLGNSVFTAAGYPIISLSTLSESDYRGSAVDYLVQLGIKPIPGFLFSPFGMNKPIFSFNAELTESIGSKLINDGAAISVYTSGAPFIYYKPMYLVFLIHIFIYFIIGMFCNYISDLRILSYYVGVSIFFLHRSNLLDIVSFLIISYLVIFLLKKI
jgi:hypothetical protein